MRPSSRWLPCLFGCGLFVTAAFAHDPTASRTTGRLHREWIGFETKIAAETAWSLVQQQDSTAMFQRETFETTVQPVLVAWARTSLHQMEAGGRRLTPREVEVILIDDNLIFRISYPRPPGSQLRITTPFLAQVDPTYVAHLTILDERDQPVLEKAQTKTDPRLEVDLRASVAPRSAIKTWWNSLWAKN